MLRTTGLVVLLALAPACASSPGGGRAGGGGRCALASLYAQRHIDAAMVPVQGGSELNDWADDVVAESLADAQKRLGAALQCSFVPVSEVVGAGTYASIPQESDPSKWTAVQGMRPIRLDGSADPLLARLGRDVGADVVVVVRAAFALQMSADDDLGSNRQFGAADFGAIAVGSDGKRVLDSSQIVESPTYSFSLGEVPPELQASALQKEARRLSKIALAKGVDGLAPSP